MSANVFRYIDDAVLALSILEVFRWVEKWMAPEANAHDEEF